MSQRRETAITLVAVVVLGAIVPVTFAISDARERQVTTEMRVDLTDEQVTARQSTADYDGDGIPDSSDDCPTRPETKNGFQDGDGCPDVVATTGAS
ncbi:MAG: hypothetical protein ACI8XM_000475 [Haloarculaceae archaeon]|jgi:hypothetical protein